MSAATSPVTRIGFRDRAAAAVAVLAWTCAAWAGAFVLMGSRVPAANVAGVLLSVHAMILAAYLIHEAAHRTLFAAPVPNALAGARPCASRAARRQRHRLAADRRVHARVPAGVLLTTRVTTVFLACEITVIVGLGILGIVSPRVAVPFSSLYAPPRDWSVLGSGVLLGMWMLANFDSAINYIEEARIPVRTVQRALLIVLTSAFLIYSIAAIGWQYAIPVETLAKITENGDGGPIGAIARIYLPPALSWIAILVVISSAMAGLQVSMTAGARTAYRMAQEGHLPRAFGGTNRFRAPWVSVVVIGAIAVALVWYKPLAEVTFYYNAAVVTLALAYMSALAAFVRLMFRRLRFLRALAASLLPLLALAVLGYLLYSAGAEPAEPKDKYQAWYIGIAVLISGALIVMLGRASKRTADGGVT